MNNYAKIKQFDWKTFSLKANKLLNFASRSTISPVNADRWEEIVFHVLKSMGQKYKGGDPRWESGSHAPGADLWIDSFAISAKAGGIKNSTLCLSSYRLTRFDDLESMKNFIDNDGKKIDIYLCCARIDKRDGSRDYIIFLVPSNIFIAKKLDWSKIISAKNNKISGWRGTSRNGIIVDIQKSMSNQLWIKIPLKLCVEIGNIHLPKELLGVALSEEIDKK